MGQTRFEALDINSGYQVKNLIRATVLNSEELAKFIDFSKNDESYQLQARNVETNEKININF
jgi:hypothetical protein